MTSHVRHPMQSCGSGKMTASASAVDLGLAPLAMPTPPIASSAMNATIGAAPFRRSRRESSGSAAVSSGPDGSSLTADPFLVGQSRRGRLGRQRDARGEVLQRVHVAQYAAILHVEVHADVGVALDDLVEIGPRIGRRDLV